MLFSMEGWEYPATAQKRKIKKKKVILFIRAILLKLGTKIVDIGQMRRFGISLERQR
jgi:hypothetical protein